MRIGGYRDASAFLLIALGAIWVLVASITPFSVLRYNIYSLVVTLLLGVSLWRAGQWVRARRPFGFHFAVAVLLVFIATPFLFGGRPTVAAAAIELVVLSVTILAWIRASRVPGA